MSAPGATRALYADLESKLTVFELVWHHVVLACLRLSATLELARDATAVGRSVPPVSGETMVLC